MRYLGIDYGMKNIGIALSNEEGKFAMPETVLKRQNDRDLVEEIKIIIASKKIQMIVMGESKDFKGNDNSIMPELLKFKSRLEVETKLPVHLEPEFLSSHQAAKLQGKKSKNPSIDMIHASAAAIILQSFLDTQAATKLEPQDEEFNSRWNKDRP